LCTITARNSRGEGSGATVGPIVVQPPHLTNMASCTGSSGSLKFDPGVKQNTAQSHTLDLTAPLGRCTGPYVSAARMTLSLTTTPPASAGSIVGVTNSGPGTLH